MSDQINSMTINDFEDGKKVRINSVSPDSFNIWYDLMNRYPMLKKPCQCFGDEIMEVATTIRKKYVVVKLQSGEFSIFNFKDLELLD